jgi:hypothetical protein
MAREQHEAGWTARVVTVPRLDEADAIGSRLQDR